MIRKKYNKQKKNDEKKLTKESFQLKWKLSSVKYQEITQKNEINFNLRKKNNKSNNNDTNNINLGLKKKNMKKILWKTVTKKSFI